MLAAESDEVHSVTGNADCELWILLRVLHCILKHLSVENVHIEVVCTLCEVTVHHCDEVVDLVLLSWTERLRKVGERVDLKDSCNFPKAFLPSELTLVGVTII